ncbi:uncharacterized protein LOC119680431 [Teleopsis dalmanni]|uniref:uncharacterized protein LOC119680431 n=1 Tax=Teleopsis dalmanni TaxID=139649 RepID=UPI0018CCD4BF|nr:uncharacterized protein LOC119680431 [Teleopsis dalmanni]
MSNGVMCDSYNSYKLCDDGVPIGTSKSCGLQACTSSNAICEYESSIVHTTTIVIPCEGSCAKCPDNSAEHNGFTCVTDTKFVRCANETPVYDHIFTCEPTEVCSNDLYLKEQTICAEQCVLDHYGFEKTCGTSLIPTEPPPTTTSSPDQLKVVCAAVQTTKTYFYTTNTNDLTCRAYIYCEYRKNVWTAIGMACPEGYFSDAQQKCVTGEKPSTCPE